MHRRDASTETLTEAIFRYATERVRMDPPPLDGPRTPAELPLRCGGQDADAVRTVGTAGEAAR